MSKTRMKLINSALTLFSNRGYADVSTRQLSAEAGVSEVTLFRHFPSKRDLFLAVQTEKIHRPSLEYMTAHSFTGQWHTDLSRFSGILKQYVEENKELLSMMLKDSERNCTELSEYNTFLKELTQLCTDYMERFWAQKKRGKAESLSQSFICALLGIYLNHYILKMIPGKNPIEEDTDRIIKSFYLNQMESIEF